MHYKSPATPRCLHIKDSIDNPLVEGRRALLARAIKVLRRPAPTPTRSACRRSDARRHRPNLPLSASGSADTNPHRLDRSAYRQRKTNEDSRRNLHRTVAQKLHSSHTLPDLATGFTWFPGHRRSRLWAGHSDMHGTVRSRFASSPGELLTNRLVGSDWV